MSGPEKPAVPADVEAYLRSWLGEAWNARALHGDASVRAYFRVATREGAQFMLAYYPESVREGLVRFLEAYRAIEEHARVPAVVRYGEATIVQDDVGDATLFDLLRDDRAAALRYYREAIDLLVEFQRAPEEARAINPPFDSARFRAELQMTADYYVTKLVGRNSSQKLFELFDDICDRIAAHPYVLCHRDYHGQNLHIHNNVLYMIDYQDLRMGPDTYDLASLLRDRGVAEILGEATELELLAYYARRAELPGDVEQRYFETLLQRSIKVVGTFARQAIERQRLHYLDFIPAALSSIGVCVAHLPRYRPLLDEFPLEFSPGTGGA